MMTIDPIFPTHLHLETAELTREYFVRFPEVDTVLVVNSCARGHAVPESDLDLAILVNPGTEANEIRKMEADWQAWSSSEAAFIRFKNSSPFASLHVDVIEGKYEPGIMENGGSPDYFEVEIGNQVRYSAVFGDAGPYFGDLQQKWLPFYNEELRMERLKITKSACEYDLNQIDFLLKRELHFHAFDRLYIAFQKLLQALFISAKVYPISYSKWIKLQVETWLERPDLYAKLPSIISVSNIESYEISDKAAQINELLLTL